MKMPIRPEKVEEIKAVWTSPKFKTNNQRLVHLLRHCKKVEYGYTIREFAHARSPDKMAADPKDDGGWGEYYALKGIHEVFRRFRKDMENHEVLLAAQVVNGIWYHYNIIQDEEAFKAVRLRAAKRVLGIQRISEKMKDILEMSHEDREILSQRTHDEIMREVAKRQEKKKRKGK